jgi:iron complex outermembrane recepter protein
LGNGASYTPRWGLVTPSEIERVDVLYGPFSAAYSGNSVGAVVDYQTRMPQAFEAQIKLGGFSQQYREYATDDRFGGKQASVSIGNKQGDMAWFINAERLSSSGQPLSFANRLVASSVKPTAAGVTVNGAITGLANPQNAPWVLFGATGQSHTEQQHLKIKLAYDLSSTLRASYTLGLWDNTATTTPYSYLSDTSGKPVYSGAVIVDGRQYALTPADFAYSKSRLQHWMHGLNLKSHTGGVFDWELAASLYRYGMDSTRGQAGIALPAAQTGGAGRITDLNGSGWHTLNAKGIWRANLAHTVEFGAQQERYQSRSSVFNTSDWLNGDATSLVSKNTGDTQLRSLWAQDQWTIAPTWRATLGARVEQWQASNGGITTASAPQGMVLASRRETFVSPKAAVAYQASPVWVFKTSVGRAVRMPTATELYQGNVSGAGSSATVINNDPNLKPEQSVTAEFTAERDLGNGLVRMTAFTERTRDALYNQTNYAVTPNITNVQNVAAIRTHGVELAYQGTDVAKRWLKGLDLNASMTYADSIITSNPNNPASVGKQQPRVPSWRANALVSYTINSQWVTSVGVRYSGKQYGQLDNSDTNSAAYFGFSPYFVTDIRAQYRHNAQLTTSIGVDNVGNAKYWAFHPYPQRTVHVDLKYSFK